MKATFISKENNEVKFTIEVSAEEFEAAIVKVYQANKGKFMVDGFRKGKAPRKIIETRYGEDIFFEDAINDLFAVDYPKAISELKLEVIDRPNVDFSEIKKGEGFTATITVAVYPEIEVKDYKGVEIEKPNREVTDEDVDRDMELLQKRNARIVSVERPAKEGDTVILDYSGYLDGVQFDGGTAENQSLKLGSNTFIPGFEEALIGCKAGEEKDIDLSFPDEYHAPDLAGKAVVFKCKLHEVKEEELPELNDEFAKDVSEFDTLEELKADTRKKIEVATAARLENELKSMALEKVVDANDFDIPEVMIEDEIDGMAQELDQQLRYQGMGLQQFLQFSGKDMQEFRNELREDARRKTKTRMVITAVADAEKFEISEAEIEEELKKMAELYKIDIEKLKAALGPDNAAVTEKELKMRKAVDFIYENAVIK